MVRGARQPCRVTAAQSFVQLSGIIWRSSAGDHVNPGPSCRPGLVDGLRHCTTIAGSGKRGSPQTRLEGDGDASVLNMPSPCCMWNFDTSYAAKCLRLNHFQPFKSAGGSSPQLSRTTNGAGVRPYRRLPRSRSRASSTLACIGRLMAWTRSPGTNVEADRYNRAPTPMRLKRVESWTHSCPMKSL
jgi:hypothetical protein